MKEGINQEVYKIMRHQTIGYVTDPCTGVKRCVMYPRANTYNTEKKASMLMSLADCFDCDGTERVTFFAPQYVKNQTPQMLKPKVEGEQPMKAGPCEGAKDKVIHQ